MSRFFMRWSSGAAVSISCFFDLVGEAHTLDFGNVHAELIALLQHPLPPLLDKLIEALCELVHATAQVVEAEVYRGELVRHAGCVVQ